MTTLHVSLARHTAHFRDESGAAYTVPAGSDTLAAMIVTDPPLPEELTNAIGLFMDHIEDVTREVPASTVADIILLAGPGLQALIDTHVGVAQPLPFDLSRDEAEEIFRTLATEAVADRARNPGLPADEVHRILGVCCATVATLRALQTTSLTVVTDDERAHR